VTSWPQHQGSQNSRGDQVCDSSTARIASNLLPAQHILLSVPPETCNETPLCTHPSNKIILSCMWEMISATTNTYSSSSPLLSWSLSFTLSHSFWNKERHKEERKNWNFLFSSCLLVLSGGHYMISVTKGNVVGWSFPTQPGSSKSINPFGFSDPSIWPHYDSTFQYGNVYTQYKKGISQ
jgi:hypothetical protein